MSTEKSVREIVEEWNAKAKAKGMLLEHEPWSIPPVAGSILDPPTPEGIERTAKLRKEKLARADAAKRAAAQVEEVQDQVSEPVQEHCRNGAAAGKQPRIPVE